MLIKKLLVAGAFAFITMPVVAQEAEQAHIVQITWENPEKYTDVKPSNSTRKRFRNQTFERIQKYMDDLAVSLPEGQQLSITVTDLDLAGRVRPGFMAGFDTGSDVRVIKRVYIPRIDFSYTVTDSAGKVIKSGEEKLKDMSFMDRSTANMRRDGLRYEKRMLKDWFQTELLTSAGS